MKIRKIFFSWLDRTGAQEKKALEGLDTSSFKGEKQVTEHIREFYSLYPKLFSQTFDPKKFESSAKTLLMLAEKIQREAHLISKEEEEEIKKRFEVVAAILGKKKIEEGIHGQKLLEALNRLHNEHVNLVKNQERTSKSREEIASLLKAEVAKYKEMLLSGANMEKITLQTSREWCQNLLDDVPDLTVEGSWDPSFRKAMIQSHIASLPTHQQELVLEIIAFLKIAKAQNAHLDLTFFLRNYGSLVEIVGLQDSRDWELLLQ